MRHFLNFFKVMLLKFFDSIIFHGPKLPGNLSARLVFYCDNFFFRYIYKPCLASLSPLKSFIPKTIVKLIASSITFFFIFMWHGTTWAILVWTVLNFLGITLEELARVISETKYYRTFTQKVLKTEAMHQRFKAILCTPLLALSAISSFYLFAGYDVGTVFFECFFQPSLPNSIIVLISLYSCCHVSMALENVHSRSVSLKQNIS